MPDESEPDAGRRRDEHTDSTPRTSGAQPAIGLAILLADDHPLTRDVLAAMLTGRGHRVTSVADGAAALEAVEGGRHFDVIVMDVRMPVLDGIAATQALRRRERETGAPPVPIIGLTAMGRPDDAARCLAAGMDTQVAKPIDWPVLFEALSDIAARPKTLASHRRVLDHARLDRLAGGMGREPMVELLSRFTLDLDDRLLAIEADLPRIAADQVHAIRGAAGLLGFEELADLCGEIEAQARAGQGSAPIGRLRDAIARARAAAATNPHARHRQFSL